MSEDQKGGMVHFNGGVDYALCGVLYLKDGKRVIYEKNGQVINSAPLPEGVGTIYIRSVSGFEERDENKQYTTEGQRFLYSLDNRIFIPFGEEFRMGTANFRGDMIGICTYNNKEAKGYIDVDDFSYYVGNKSNTQR